MRHYHIIVPAVLAFVLCALFATPVSAIYAPLEPTQVALGPDGNVYAIMVGNESVCNNIFVFSPDGRMLKDIDAHASSIAFDEAGKLYVLNGTLQANSTNYTVWKYDRNGTTTAFWRDSGNETNLAIGAMAVSPDGHVYVDRFYTDRDVGVNESGRNESRIFRLDADGSEHIVYNTSIANIFKSMAIDKNGTIYGSLTNYIRVIAPNGTLTSFGKPGSANGTFNMITDATIGKDGYLYVTEYGNRRVQKLTTDGTPVDMWNGAGLDRFRSPFSAAADENGTVYVCDGENQRIVWVTPGYAFGENTTENMKGQGTTWGNVYAGANYTTMRQQVEEENAEASTPGFEAFASSIGLFLAGTALYLWRTGIRR